MQSLFLLPRLLSLEEISFEMHTILLGLSGSGISFCRINLSSLTRYNCIACFFNPTQIYIQGQKSELEAIIMLTPSKLCSIKWYCYRFLTQKLHVTGLWKQRWTWGFVVIHKWSLAQGVQNHIN